jgi:hypothetical protein
MMLKSTSMALVLHPLQDRAEHSMEKTRELLHLLHFKEACPFFPEGEIEKTEMPDFIVHAQGRTLGIEHTEAFQPGPPHGESFQAQDSLAQRVVDEAEYRYRQRHSQPLLVQILFKPRAGMSKQRIPTVAEMLVRLIEATHVESGTPVTLRRTQETLGCFPREVALIHLYSHPGGRQNLWRCSSAGFIPQLVPEDLQAIVDRKERKRQNYAAKCPEVWLLIAADDVRIPSTVDLKESALDHRYDTGFDRVFFFWNSRRTFVELQTCV